MSRISPETCLRSGHDAIRAWELGPARNGSAVIVDTVWLPQMSFGEDLGVETLRGVVPAGELTPADWLRVTKPDTAELEPELPYYLHLGGREATRVHALLRRSNLVTVVDMMQCRIAHWRSDIVMLRVDLVDGWFGRMLGEGGDSWWMRVLSITRGFAETVALSGSWEAHGVPVAA